MTSDQALALMRRHFEGDLDGFRRICSQIRADAASANRHPFAEKIRRLLEDEAPKAVVLRPREDHEALLVSQPTWRLSDMVLAVEARGQLVQVLKEQEARDRLRAYGLQPARRLLFLGPPGTGKTMAAGALAKDLGLSLHSVSLHGLISQFLGQTAGKLRQVFDLVRSSRGVYLFDEFDALGAERGEDAGTKDTREMHRALNSLLQFLEEPVPCDSVVIMATNHVGLLDRALFRRFDMTIAFGLPSLSEVAILMQGAVVGLASAFGCQEAARVAVDKRLSHGEVVSACQQAAKTAILRCGEGESPAVSTEDLLVMLQGRYTKESDEKS